MYRYESCLPSNSKIFRQDKCTWWKRDQYMAVHSPDLNFSGQMSDHYPAPYPIGHWNEWSLNMGMSNMHSPVFPCFESSSFKFYRSSRRNYKTSTPKMSEISEQGFQLQNQIGQQNSKPVHSAYSKQHCQVSPRHLPSPVSSSSFKQEGQFGARHIPRPAAPWGFQQQRQLGPMQIPLPVRHIYHKPYKNSNNNISGNQVCRFCLQNGEGEAFSSGHRLKDHNGKVTCPILRKYVCEICNATGDIAHTKAYCPFFKEKNKKPLAVILKQTCHDSSGRIRK